MDDPCVIESLLKDEPQTPSPPQNEESLLATSKPNQPITDDPSSSQPITDLPSASPQPIRIEYRAENQDAFDSRHHRVSPRNFTWRSAITSLRNRCHCNRSCAVTTLRRHLPVVDLFMKYRLREYILGDIVAGISLAILTIPQSMGYALLASLPPIIGLYTSFFPVFIYFIFGRSNHVSVGTMALTSLILATVIDKTIPQFIKENNLEEWTNQHQANITGNYSNSTSDLNNPITQEAISIAMSMSFMSGIFLVGMSFLQLGFLATYISDAFMSGYIAGCNFQVLTHQVKHMLGVTVGSYSGPLSIFKIIRDMVLELKNTNVATLVTSIIATTTLILIKKLVNERYAKKLRIPVPIDIIVVIIATIISYFCEFEERFGVKIVDDIPQGLPEPTVPSTKHMSEFVMDAFILGLVNYVLLFMMVKMFSQKYNQPYDANQEMFATGLCGIFGAFFSSIAASTAPPRCILGDETGGKTQIVQLISAFLVLLTLLFVAPLLQPLPLCILASLIVASCIPLFRYYTMCLLYWRTSKHDLAVWTVSFLATLLIGVDIGILIGVGFSMVVVILRTQRPYATTIKPSAVDNSLLDAHKYNTKFTQTNGVVIFRFEAPLYFANIDIFKEELFRVGGNPADLIASPRVTIIEPPHNGLPTEMNLIQDVKIVPCEDLTEQDKQCTPLNGPVEQTADMTIYKGQDEMSALVNKPLDQTESLVSKTATTRIFTDEPQTKSIVIDCSSIPFLDTTGATLLGLLHSQYEKADVIFSIANVSETCRRILGNVKGCDGLVAQHMYATLYNAVLDTSLT